MPPSVSSLPSSSTPSEPGVLLYNAMAQTVGRTDLITTTCSTSSATDGQAIPMSGIDPCTSVGADWNSIATLVWERFLEVPWPQAQVSRPLIADDFSFSPSVISQDTHVAALPQLARSRQIRIFVIAMFDGVGAIWQSLTSLPFTVGGLHLRRMPIVSRF